MEVAAAAQSPRLTREEIVLQTRLGPLLWLPHAADDAHGARSTHRHAEVVRAVGERDGSARARWRPTSPSAWTGSTARRARLLRA